MNTELIKKLCSIPGVSGDEQLIKDFILNYVNENKHSWAQTPRILQGEHLQDAIILVFGVPRTAVYAHLDTVGFCVGYDKNLTRVGSPRCDDNTELFGYDFEGNKLTCAYLQFEDDEGSSHHTYVGEEILPRGMNLSYLQEWQEDESFIQSCYLDNRLGVWNALQLCETLKDGAIVFSTYEEHGGGSVGFLADLLYSDYGVRQALISDITWVTDGVKHGEGVAISVRDSGIPRRKYLNRILKAAEESGIKYQLEIESAGGSDGTAIQRSHLPVDWVFIGAPEDNVHSPKEIVHKGDIQAMVELYKHLMDVL